MSKVNVVNVASFDSLRRLSFSVYFKMKMKTMTTF